jgi:hypothetical protein
MKLALQNVRTVPTPDGARLAAELVATDYGFSIEVSAWAELLSQYGPDLTKLALVKEAILSAQVKLTKKKALAASNLVQAQALAAAYPAPADLSAEATTEQQTAHAAALAAHQQAQKTLATAQAYSAALAAFEVEMTADIPVRVDAFYSGLKAKYEGDFAAMTSPVDPGELATEEEKKQYAEAKAAYDTAEARPTHVQEEWDAWTASQVDASVLEGVV